MEDISPTPIFLWEIKRALEKGLSIHSGVERYIQRNSETEFAAYVEAWWSYQLNKNPSLQKRNFKEKPHITMTRKYLFEILELGLKGQSILETLKNYEKELIQSCEDEIQSHIAGLPLILMIPLMGLIFPALMILLIGPLLSSLSF
jgi:hypothetical protein